MVEDKSYLFIFSINRNFKIMKINWPNREQVLGESQTFLDPKHSRA